MKRSEYYEKKKITGSYDCGDVRNLRSFNAKYRVCYK